MDPFNTEGIKYEHNIKNKNYYRLEEDVQNTIKTVSFTRQ